MAATSIHVALLITIILTAALFGDLVLLPALLLTFPHMPRKWS